jgi:hypothetical protein
MYLPLFQEDWREAVRSFVSAEKRSVFGIDVSVAKSGGSIIAFDSWTNSERSAVDLAEGIASWIELHSEGMTESCEATISISAPTAKPPCIDASRNSRWHALSARRLEQLGRGFRILAAQTQRMILL